MQPDEPNDEERLEQLPEDGPTPFSPPDDQTDDTAAQDDQRAQDPPLDDTHPATDSQTNIQPEEEYDEGLSGATETPGEPNAGNAVVDYTPPDSEDKS